MTAETLIDDALKKELAALYRASDRHYHSMSHIEAMLGLLEAHRVRFSDPEAVEAAIWFHDAIYDSRRNDNEARSANLAAERLGGHIEPERLARIVAMIQATATHALPDQAGSAAEQDAAYFLDIDLSILGAGQPEFDTYEAAVRQEYAWVEDQAWRSGRAAVLRNFLDRPSIFHTELFRGLYEATARENIVRSLAALISGQDA